MKLTWLCNINGNQKRPWQRRVCFLLLLLLLFVVVVVVVVVCFFCLFFLLLLFFFFFFFKYCFWNIPNTQSHLYIPKTHIDKMTNTTLVPTTSRTSEARRVSLWFIWFRKLDGTCIYWAQLHVCTNNGVIWVPFARTSYFESLFAVSGAKLWNIFHLHLRLRSSPFIRMFDPAHEIMVLFVLRKLILQMHMRSHPVGLDVWCLVGPFVYFHTSCVRVRTAKDLVRLRGCAGSPEPSLVAYVISTIISWAGSFYPTDFVRTFFSRTHKMPYRKSVFHDGNCRWFRAVTRT